MTTLSAHPLLIGTLGVQELLIVLLIILVIFGASKLPALGKGLGEGIRNFKSGLKADDTAKQIDDAESPRSGTAD